MFGHLLETGSSAPRSVTPESELASRPPGVLDGVHRALARCAPDLLGASVVGEIERHERLEARAARQRR